MTTDEPRLRATIAERIRVLRARSGRAQGIVALGLGVSQSTLSNYEHAVREPPITMLVRLARYYSVPLAEIVSERDGA